MTTVNELIELLEECKSMGHGQKEVKFSRGSGDYWHTQIADSVTEVNVGRVIHSVYHDKDEVIDQDESRDESREIILLS